MQVSEPVSGFQAQERYVLEFQFMKTVFVMPNLTSQKFRVRSERYIANYLHRKSSLANENRKSRRKTVIWLKIWRTPAVNFALNLQFSVGNQLHRRNRKETKKRKEKNTRRVKEEKWEKCLFLSLEMHLFACEGRRRVSDGVTSSGEKAEIFFGSQTRCYEGDPP